MTNLDVPGYHHTQKGPWGLMCYAFAAAFVVVALYPLPHSRIAPPVFG
jgi:hypothetical protein